MEYLASINFEEIVEDLLFILGNWGFIIVIIFGIMHPLFENPLSLMTMALSFLLLGYPLGFLVVFSSNLIGILLLYFFAQKFNEKSKDVIYKNETSSKIMTWIRTTKTWRHILVIGVPMIPTYPIKVAVPLSKIGFRKYLITLIGAYLFLYIGNFFIYFGLLGFITNNIPQYLSFILLSLFVLYVYFGKAFFKKNKIYD